MKQNHVYILSSPSGTLYTGMTSDLVRRVYQHKEKIIEGFTKKYNVTRLVFFENFAVNQAQIKVVFGSDTKTGRVIAEELFELVPQKVKHEVADPQAQGRAHPYYESLMEQKELFVKANRNQKRRNMFVLPPESTQAIALRTLTVPTTR